MQNNNFNVGELSYVPNCSLEEKIKEKVNKIIESYKEIKEDSLKITKFSIGNELGKSIILYNLFFSVEISLKYFIIRRFKYNIDEIETIGHDISKLIEIAKNVYEIIDFMELEMLLRKIKNKNNKTIELKKYSDFKYNHAKGRLDLIFDSKINENELQTVKEVIVWLEKNI